MSFTSTWQERFALSESRRKVSIRLRAPTHRPINRALLQLDNFSARLKATLQQFFPDLPTAVDLPHGLRTSFDAVQSCFTLQLVGRHHRLHATRNSSQLLSTVHHILLEHRGLREGLGHMLHKLVKDRALQGAVRLRGAEGAQITALSAQDLPFAPQLWVSAAISAVLGTAASFEIPQSRAASGATSASSPGRSITVTLIDDGGRTSVLALRDVFGNACRLWWARYLLLRRQKQSQRQLVPAIEINQWICDAESTLAILSCAIFLLLLCRARCNERKPFDQPAWEQYWYPVLLLCASFCAVLDALRRVATARGGLDFLRHLEDVRGFAAQLRLSDIDVELHREQHRKECALLDDAELSLLPVTKSPSASAVSVAASSSSAVASRSQRGFVSADDWGLLQLHPDVQKLQLHDIVKLVGRQTFHNVSVQTASLRRLDLTDDQQHILAEVFYKPAPSAEQQAWLGENTALILQNAAHTLAESSNSGVLRSLRASDFHVRCTFSPSVMDCQGPHADCCCQPHDSQPPAAAARDCAAIPHGTVSFIFEYAQQFFVVSTGHTVGSEAQKALQLELVQTHDMKKFFASAITCQLSQWPTPLPETIQAVINRRASPDLPRRQPIALALSCRNVLTYFGNERGPYATLQTYNTGEASRTLAAADVVRCHAAAGTHVTVPVKCLVGPQVDVSAGRVEIAGFTPQSCGYQLMTSTTIAALAIKLKAAQSLPAHSMSVSYLRARSAFLTDSQANNKVRHGQLNVLRSRAPAVLSGLLFRVRAGGLQVQDDIKNLTVLRQRCPFLQGVPDELLPQLPLILEGVQVHSNFGPLPGDCGALLVMRDPDHPLTLLPVGIHQFLDDCTDTTLGFRYTLTGVGILHVLRWLLTNMPSKPPAAADVSQSSFNIWIKSGLATQ